jgi:hypothetical protein
MRFATSFLLMRSQPVNPQYWSLLSDDDKDVYLRIKAALSAPSLRNKRNTRMESFQGILEAIEAFENTEAANKWKRCLVCGMCLFRDGAGIAVSTSQLKRLIFRCRSSINGSLKGLGYGQIVTIQEAGELLLREIPYLGDNPAELRRWTIRMKDAAPPRTGDVDVSSFPLQDDLEDQVFAFHEGPDRADDRFREFNFEALDF